MARVVTIVQTSSSIPTTSGISIVISQTTNPGSVVGGISDVAYNETTWNGNLDGASKNVLRDKFVTMDADLALKAYLTDLVSLFITARNSTGSTITKGSVVYVSGVTGQKPNILLAKADAEATSHVVGIASFDIPNNTNVDNNVTISGLITDVDTSAFVDADPLYLSPSTAGLITKTAPSSPNFNVDLGHCLYSHAVNGKILVNIQKAISLNTTLDTSNRVSPSNNAVKHNLDLKFNLSGGSLSGVLNNAQGANIASASTTDIGAATGNYVNVTGTTTITALGTVQAGSTRIVNFNGALTLTHNGTSLILPTGANITTVAGDCAIFVSLGSGNWVCTHYQRKDGSALLGGGGLTNWTDSLNSSAPNATITVSEFTATNAATNVDAAIKAKGTGAHLAQTPDSTATGGDKRGQYAVDWQKVRAAADQVASGNYSTIGGGERNKASAGWTTVAGGYNNRARGATCVVGGGESNDAANNSSTVSGGSSNATANDYAFITGGLSNSCSGYISGVLGGSENSSTYHYTLSSGYRSKAYLYGQMSRASGMFGAVGDAQGSALTLRRAITGTTATELFLDGSALQAVLNSNSAWNAEISVVAIIKTVGDGTVTLGDVHGSNYRVTIKNIGGTTALVGSVEQIGTDSNDAGMAGCDVTITADNTNDCLKITFTPPTAAGSTTVTRVVASVKLTEVAN